LPEYDFNEFTINAIMKINMTKRPKPSLFFGSFVNSMVLFAKDSGRNGVSVIGDMAPFFYFGKNAGLLYYVSNMKTWT